jgi:hypothetical protein
VPASLWRAVWEELHERINLVGDPQTKDAARIFYLPQHAPDQPFEFHEGHGSLLDSSFTLDVQVASNPVAPRAKQARQPCAIRSNSYDDAWWDEPVDISRWDGMTEKEKHQAMYKEWTALYSQLSIFK